MAKTAPTLAERIPDLRRMVDFRNVLAHTYAIVDDALVWQAAQHNRAAHRLLVDGVTVEYRMPDGTIRGAQAQVLDFDNTDANDWLAVNQFTVATTYILLHRRTA